MKKALRTCPRMFFWSSTVVISYSVYWMQFLCLAFVLPSGRIDGLVFSVFKCHVLLTMEQVRGKWFNNNNNREMEVELRFLLSPFRKRLKNFCITCWLLAHWDSGVDVEYYLCKLIVRWIRKPTKVFSEGIRFNHISECSFDTGYFYYVYVLWTIVRE